MYEVKSSLVEGPYAQSYQEGVARRAEMAARHRITLDGALLAEVPPVLLQAYLLEQMSLHRWQVLVYDWRGRSIEVMEAGRVRVLAWSEVQE